MLEPLVPDKFELLATHFDLHDQTNTKLTSLYLKLETNIMQDRGHVLRLCTRFPRVLPRKVTPIVYLIYLEILLLRALL